ncbi:MAG: hypothetical protein H7Y42_10065 [Chitinophagaceae bacterium]|nr:hypothetical protein [Chitinophagaceae bacterium]
MKQTPMLQEKEDQQETTNEEPYTFNDEATKKKVKKHISDINDVITENDIKNVQVPGKEKPTRVRKRKPVSKESKEASTDGNREHKAGNGPEGHPVTPWDVVD